MDGFRGVVSRVIQGVTIKRRGREVWLGGLLLLLGVAGYGLAWTSERATQPLFLVAAPSGALPHPHPVQQLVALRPGTTEAYVSAFVDLGQSSDLADAHGPAGGDLYVRSAHHPRAFLIHRPIGPDREFVLWQRVGSEPRAVRRFVQFAVVRSPGAGPALQAAEVVFQWRHRVRVLLLLPLLALLVATVRIWWPALGRVVRGHWPALIVGLLALLTVARLWTVRQVNGDEVAMYGLARGVLETQSYTVDWFTYPHLLVYGQVAVTMAYGVVRAAQGLAFHDPFTNQLYFDGQLLPPRILTPAIYPGFFYLTALPWLRHLYALIPALAIVAAFAVARRAATTRAGLLAACAVAAQPLLMRAEALPNTPAMLLALVLTGLLLKGTKDAGRSFGAGFLTGMTAAFKFNPAFVVTTPWVLLADWPQGRRLRATLLAAGAAVVGFLVCYPTVFANPRALMAGLAFDAHHYAQGGHRGNEFDSALPAMLHATYLRPEYPGTWLVLATAVLGLLFLVSRRQWRGVLILTLPVAVSLALMSHQFVQFGRNYASAACLICVLSGVGADGLSSWVATRVGRWRGAANAACAGLLAAIILGTGVAAYGVQQRVAGVPTARERAIQWADEHLPLGARLAMVEPLTSQIQGWLPDQRRFRVRTFAEPTEWRDFDFVILSNQTARPPNQGVVARFKGPGVWKSLADEYVVIRVDGSGTGGVGEGIGAEPRQPPNGAPPAGIGTPGQDDSPED